MSKRDVVRQDALDVFLEIQTSSMQITPTAVADRFGTINTAYARQIIAELKDRGLVYESEGARGGELDGFTWEQGDQQAFDEAWPVDETNNQATTEKEAPKMDSTKPKSDKTNKPCACGCGETTRSLYRPGHDARHASRVAQEMVGQDDAARRAWLTNLPTPALRTKALRIYNRLTKQAQAKAIKQAAREAAKATREKIEWEMGYAKVGRWVYPARKRPNATKTAYVNERRDGTGAWKELALDKFSTEPIEA